MPLFALIGMGLSLVHQSSLGATYGVLMARPVWYSPSAPVLFILSAVASGIAAIIALTALTGSFMNKFLLPSDVLRGLTRFAGIMALAYLYLKLWSWLATQYYSHSPAVARDLELLAEHTPYGFTFWWFEILLGTLIPAIIFLWPRTRGNRLALIIAGALSVLGLITFRWNTTLSGLVVPLDWSPGVEYMSPVVNYTPSLVEWGVTIGIVGYWWLAWSLAARFVNLFPYARNPGEPEVVLEHDENVVHVPSKPVQTPAAGD
jgi:molybdopterin-containing oxidoreductase family membrane subunit